MRLDGKKMKEAREAKLLTVRELCQACGMSTCTWARASQGDNMRVTTVRRICEVLDVAPEQIKLKEGNDNEQ